MRFLENFGMLIAKIQAQSHLPDIVPGLSRLTPSWGILRWTIESGSVKSIIFPIKSTHRHLQKKPPISRRIFPFPFRKKTPVSQPLQFPQAVRIPKAMAGAETAPFCAVIGCADLRTPVEQIFDSMPGEIFVLRMLGARHKVLGFSYENWAIMITHRKETYQPTSILR